MKMMRPLVIFIDDDKQRLQAAALLFDGYYNYEVRTAWSATRAKEIARSLERPATLFLNPHVGGPFEGVTLLRTMQQVSRQPLVAVYISIDVEDGAQALSRGGAIAYLVRPCKRDEVEAYRAAITTYVGVVTPEQVAIARMATHDPLTELLNRRGFRELAVRELARAARDKTPTSSIFADIDDFKLVNDTFGYDVGDATIVAVAHCIKLYGRVRITDLVGRRGGEEFVILLPETNGAQAKVVAARLEQAVKELRVPADKERCVSVTVSTGVLTIGHADIKADRARTLERILDHSSKLMKREKRRKKEARLENKST